MLRLRRNPAVLLCVLAAGMGMAGTGRKAALGPDEIAVHSGSFDPQAAFTVNANLVQVDVTVLGADGRPVGGLGAGDFRLEDNGAAQQIVGFEAVKLADAATGAKTQAGGGKEMASARGVSACGSRGQRTVLLYFDDVTTDSSQLGYARQQALGFLKDGACGDRLPLGERVGVVTASGRNALAATDDVGRLRKVVAAVIPHPFTQGDSFCPLITPGEAWDILHMGEGSDAMQFALKQASKCQSCGTPQECFYELRTRAEEVWSDAENAAAVVLDTVGHAVSWLAQQPGRRALVLASSGFMTQGLVLQQRQQQLIDAALHANVTIDAMDVKGLEAPNAMGAWNDPWITDPRLSWWRLQHEAGGFSLQDSAMWEIAESTGGSFLHDNNDLRGAYARDVEGPSENYVLSFARPDLKADGAFHRLKVQVTAPGVHRVAARYGYFAPEPQPAWISAALRERLRREALGCEHQGGVESALRTRNADGGVQVDLHIAPASLRFTPSRGRHEDHLTVLLALLTCNGQFVAGRREEVELQLKASGWALVSKQGLQVGAALAASPGLYRLRVVIYEQGSGALTTMTAGLLLGGGDAARAHCVCRAN